MFKRFLSVFLAVALIVTVMGIEPAAAASQTGVWDGTVDISWYDPNATVYDIGTPAQLAGLAALINGMTDPNCPKLIGNAAYLKTNRHDGVALVGAGGGSVSDTVYVSNIDFAYKTVRLTADLDMGGSYNPATGAWTGPNWTPIGGKYPMKPGEVKGDCLVLDTRFNGVFDGQGHTVKNIYCDRYAAKGFPYSMAIGLIGFLGGPSDLEKNLTGDFENGWVPTVHNVIVGKGSFYGRRMVGGVVGRVGTTKNGVIIENCANYADVKNTDSKGVGGVCGTGWGDGMIRNCYNSGSVTTTYSCPAGGICGSNGGMDIYNCYNVGRINSNGEKIGRGIGGHDAGSYTVGNSYYLSGSDDDPLSGGYYKGSSSRVTVSIAKLSASEMQGKTFLDKLNVSGAVYAPDSNGINGGFPVLWYQVGTGSASGSVTVQNPSAGGTVSADRQTASYGQTVNFSAKPDAGWILDHFVVNGKAIDSNFYIMTGDITVSAVFSQVRSVTISIPKNEDFYLAVVRTGYKLSGSEMVWVAGECLADGDIVLEGNTLKLLAHGYPDVSHPDLNKEYTDGFTFAMDHAEKKADGSYRVKGDGNIAIQAERNARPKSWVNLADTSWYNSWHPAKSYTLTTAGQLAGLARLVNDKGISFSGTAIMLGNDISLQNTDGTTGVRSWTAIGSSASNAFEGTLDGQNHTISDMTAWNDGSYSGLFGYCNSAVIKNVKLIGTSADEASASYAAGIAAYASGGTIENCSVDVDVTANGTHAAGIAAGISDGTIINGCFNFGKISGVSGVGGIVGVSGTGTDRITGCGNFGDVSGAGSDTYGVGGIVGRLSGKMDACVNQGTVTGSDRYIGGLAGYTTTRYNSMITLSQNTGTVSSNCSNETAAVGGLAGFAQYLSYGGCNNKGTVKTGSSFTAQSRGDLIGKAGDIEEVAATGVIPEFHAVRPMAVSPAAPTATDSAIGNDRAVQVANLQNLVNLRDGITASGTYFIPWFASGRIDIGSGLDVTLKGTNGGEAGFENLMITAGDNTAITLEDVKLSGITTLLQLGRDDTLTLKGSNVLNGNSDVRNNEQPTAILQGNLTIQGSGTLKIGSKVNNAAVFVWPGSTIVQNSGTLAIDKVDLLGLNGGAFYAAGSKVMIKGGSFSGHTNSDNVSILSADELTISGGTVRVQAERSPYTLVSLKTVVSGGTIMTIGHSGNSSAEKRYYYDAQSIPNLTAAAGVFQKSSLPFLDVSVNSEYYDAVGYCVGKNYFAGTGATTFSPDGTMTRAMFASVLYRMAGSPSVKGSVTFTDLNQNWYKNAVIWAVQSGITSGTGASAFSPDAPVTREQTALFLSRFAKLRGKDISVQGTNLTLPEGISAWAEDAAGWTLEKGILKGGAGEMAAPGANASRGLLALVLMRYDAVK